MGTAQNQGVHPRILQGRQILPGHGLDHHVSPPDAPGLRQGHEQGAGPAEHGHLRVQPPESRLVGTGADGGRRGNEPYPLVLGHQHRPAASGLYHAYHGQVVFRLQRRQRGGSHRSAGDEDGLQIEGAQETHILAGVFQNGLPGTAAIGHPGGVAEVDQVLLRQDAPEGVHRRQTPQA